MSAIGQLSEIWIYPLKSGRGTSLLSAELGPMGLQWDRRWMLVDDQGRFLSQRELPMMARLDVRLEHETAPGLHFRFGQQKLSLPLPPYELASTQVTVWNSTIPAQVFEPEVNRWFSQCLGLSCRLVYMPESSYRATNPDFAPDKRVSFADGYPYLLCNLASLRELNEHLLAKGLVPVGIDRFRANLVVETERPFAEDHWRKLQIGTHHFEIVKPCERCVIVTTDQLSGERSKEPLRTLSELHKLEGKVIFGQNMICASESGQLQLGDQLVIQA